MRGPSGKIEPHHRAPQLWLEAHDEHQQGQHRCRIEHPARDQEIKLVGQERAEPQGQNAQGHAQRTRFAAPLQYKIDRDGQDHEVDSALPPKGDHRENYTECRS